MKLKSLRALFLACICLFSSSLFAQVNINTASAEEISQALKGVGPAKAAAIVAYREANGPFNSAEELTQVKGIGTATVQKNRDQIVTATEEAAPKQ